MGTRQVVSTEGDRILTTPTKPPRVFTCRDCPAYITAKEANYNGLCATCTQQHIDAWKAEHTRKLGDKRKGWLIGDLCVVKIGSVKYDGKIIDMSDRAEGDYLSTKLELTLTVQGLDGKDITRTWVHPEPIQSYKLRKRV